MATKEQLAQAALNRVGGQSANDRKKRQLRFRKNAKKHRKEEMSAVRWDTAKDVGKELATEAAITAATGGAGLLAKAALKGAAKGYKTYKTGKKVQAGLAKAKAAKIALARNRKKVALAAKKLASVEGKAVAKDRAKRATLKAAKLPPKAAPKPKKPASKGKPMPDAEATIRRMSNKQLDALFSRIGKGADAAFEYNTARPRALRAAARKLGHSDYF